MRIALLTTSYPEAPDDAAGHFVRAEARELARQGHEVHVVAAAPWGQDPGVVGHGCGGRALFGWPGAAARLRGNPARLLAAGPFAGRALASLRAIAPDRVVAHWAVPCGWPLGVASGRPLSLVSHGADVRLLVALPRPLRLHVVTALLDRLAPGGRIAPAARLDRGERSGWLGPSGWRFVAAATREQLLEALPGWLGGRLRERSRVEPPRVDVDGLQAPPVVMLPPGRRAVVAARLVASKRVSLAIEAVAQAAGWTLVVAGDGPEREWLEGLAWRVAPGRVVFVGRLPRPQVLGLLAGADALLHPSGTEAAPTAVSAALALGVPVVACAAGDLARWAEREPGLVLTHARGEALARALLAVR